jgi:uncharacterized membrane protein YagU involved in acid resistance
VGLIHAALRKKYPWLGKAGGLPFAVPFFLACDGVLAPATGMNPPLHRVPLALDLKELGNHIAWTAAAEGFRRLRQR